MLCHKAPLTPSCRPPVPVPGGILGLPSDETLTSPPAKQEGRRPRCGDRLEKTGTTERTFAFSWFQKHFWLSLKFHDHPHIFIPIKAAQCLERELYVNIQFLRATNFIRLYFPYQQNREKATSLIGVGGGNLKYQECAGTGKRGRRHEQLPKHWDHREVLVEIINCFFFI